MPTNIADFQDFARAVATRYSGRYAGYPFVRFFTIWNESNLATFLVPQFNASGKIVSPRELREARDGGDRRHQGGELASAQVGIGETSSNGRDKKRAGLTDTVAPATFMKGVAADTQGRQVRRLGAPPVSVPGQPEADATRPLPERDAQEHAAVREGPRHRVRAQERSRSGSPSTATRRSPASRRASPRRSRPRTSRRRSGWPGRTRASQMFVWFVMQDSQGSLWQSGIYRQDGVAEAGAAASSRRPPSRSAPSTASMTVQGRYEEPDRSRSTCASTARTTRRARPSGYTIRSYQGKKLVQVSQGARPLGIDCTVRRVCAKLTRGEEDDLPRHGDRQHGDHRGGPPHHHHRRRVAPTGCGAGVSARPTATRARPAVDRHHRGGRLSREWPQSATVVVHGAEGARTPDLLAASQTLSQLSYGPGALDCRRWRPTRPRTAPAGRQASVGQRRRPTRSRPRASGRRPRAPRGGSTRGSPA